MVVQNPLFVNYDGTVGARHWYSVRLALANSVRRVVLWSKSFSIPRSSITVKPRPKRGGQIKTGQTLDQSPLPRPCREPGWEGCSNKTLRRQCPLGSDHNRSSSLVLAGGDCGHRPKQLQQTKPTKMHDTCGVDVTTSPYPPETLLSGFRRTFCQVA